jgi:hypothetical protein
MISGKSWTYLGDKHSRLGEIASRLGRQSAWGDAAICVCWSAAGSAHVSSRGDDPLESINSVPLSHRIGESISVLGGYKSASGAAKGPAVKDKKSSPVVVYIPYDGMVANKPLTEGLAILDVESLWKREWLRVMSSPFWYELSNA